MEAEERPSKLQKLDHDIVEATVGFTRDTAVDNRESAQSPTVNGSQCETLAEFLAPVSPRLPSSIKDEETPSEEPPSASPQPKISKNALKRLRKQQKWEEGREFRKQKRKDRRTARKERIREEKKLDPEAPSLSASKKGKFNNSQGTYVPLAIVLDCNFEDLMTDNEQISLASQVTRAYSDVRIARFKPHLIVSGFQGKLKERFEGVLQSTHRHWKGVTLVEGQLEQGIESAQNVLSEQLQQGKGEENIPEGCALTPALPQQEPEAAKGEVIYLTAESDTTLETLSANTTYIIGGLVDRNRHKSLCHNKALKMDLKTAKLPIGEFMQMNSRYVLATCHVVEIMGKWLENGGDWGKAFSEVLPKRKGATEKKKGEEKGEEEKQREGGGQKETDRK